MTKAKAQKVITTLLEKGQNQGFLTSQDVLDLMPEPENDLKTLEDLFLLLYEKYS